MEHVAIDGGTVPAGINILVVDDSAMMRTMIKRVARLCEVPIATIFEASHGVEALHVLETQRIDAVFTDINMPVMTGIELLRAMDSRPEWAHVTRVIVTTDGSSARRDEVKDLHVRCYVEKPFRPEVMRDVLTEVTSSAVR
ncbi:MAG: response regulator [Vicinamibacteraceae bacterium]|nr:response regulator [Vicinamibacteraceae bacterium]